MSELRIHGNGHRRGDALGRELLAVHRLRRHLEHLAHAAGSPSPVWLAV